MSTKSDEAASEFYNVAFGPNNWHPGANALIYAAFDLYESQWASACRRFDIGKWSWPADVLAAGESFTGDQPWTVLLRRAMELRQ